MTDYGRDIQFGLFPTPNADTIDNTLELARLADRTGLELVGIQDHPYQKRFLDTWSLMGTVLAHTERVHVFPDVACLPLRPPAVMAKAAASLDLLSGGRFELGLGAGGFWQAIAAIGGPHRTPGQAATALEEAIRVIRLMWSDQPSVRYAGTHYSLDGVRPGPAPAHPMELWLGVSGPRMLRAVGGLADGWLPSSSYIPPEALAARHALIDEAAADAGRRPADIRRIYNVFGAITTDRPTGFLNGPVDQWVDELTELVTDHGMDSFIFGAEMDDLRQHELFAREVAPAVREAVAAHRGGSSERAAIR